ncbi:MAG: DNA-directed RNA polymerase subunit D [archaeon]|jgi:DNA-directed RNA polymerase subunit D|nr:DNA-directed RNA polymerase subunit D [archaeon]
MEVVQKTPELLVLKGELSESLANAIRRSVGEVPTLAVDEVEMFKNDSALYDEMVAHRIGLVPLKTEKSMNKKTRIDLKLVKTGPCTVYSGDLKGGADVVYDKMQIVILGEGQRLELVATAALGRGIEHAKYSPGLCYYRHVLEVKSTPETDKIVSSSKGLIAPEKKGNKWVCDLNEADVDAIERLEKDSVSLSNELLFVVESYGSMDAKEIFSKAIEALSENLDEFEKAIK